MADADHRDAALVAPLRLRLPGPHQLPPLQPLRSPRSHRALHRRSLQQPPTPRVSRHLHVLHLAAAALLALEIPIANRAPTTTVTVLFNKSLCVGFATQKLYFVMPPQEALAIDDQIPLYLLTSLV